VQCVFSININPIQGLAIYILKLSKRGHKYTGYLWTFACYYYI